MKTRIALTLVIAIAVLGVVFGFKFLGIRKAMTAQAAMVRPPPSVTSTTAAEEEWRASLHAVGSLESRAGIVVRAEIEGRVVNLAFTSGAKVRAGDLLVELDATVERAQLAGLEAAARLADLSLARAKDLRSQNTNSPADLDAAEAAASQAHAAVDQLQATLAKKRVVAPFAGCAGITQVDPGQFLNKGDAVVALEAIDLIYADFGLPQQDIARVQVGMPVRVTVDAFAGREFPGTVEAVEPRVSGTTRNLRIRAAIPNTDELLQPGMFARVALDEPASARVIVLPTTAIVYNPYGNAVYVVSPQKTPDGKSMLVARQQFVDLGPTRGSQVAITKGLKPGDQVVTSGQIKLRNGMPVQINNEILPSSNAAPTPAEG